MSDLLNSASLVMIPSGYKEDIVYSQIPTNGNGDLSFTRASNGTRINSAGLVEVVAWNLLQYSEDFSNGVWVKTNTTVSTNTTTAPNGTTTADSLLETTANATHQLWERPDMVAGQTFTQSCYIKTNGRNRVQLQIFDSSTFYAGALFDVVSGTIVATIGTSSIESVGNGWYRCIVSGVCPTSTTGYCVINLTTDSYTQASAQDSYTGDASKGIFIYGAQANIGSTAKPYFPTTDRLNVPRLTYQNGGGGCPSLLLEKQSTNLVSYSQDFSNAYWNKTNQGGGSVAVVTANYAISPDGTQNATRFVCNLNGGNTSSDRSWMIATFSPPATTTLSIWIKLNSAGTKTIILSDSGGDTKTISGTDWQRIDATFVGASGEFRIGLIGGSTSDTLDCCIWGAQAESGSYPTSYIPTTSASATRVADACSKTGISSLIGQTEGTMFIDFYYELENKLPNGNDKGIMTIRPNGGGTANEIALLYYGNEGSSYGQTIQVRVAVGGVTQCALSTPQTITSGYYKVAFAYKQNDFAFYINGVQIGTDSSGTVPTCSELYLTDPVRVTSPNAPKEAILFPTRLSNSELASLTTL